MSLELSVVMPAYLEAENLRLLLPRLKSVLDKANLAGYEILVVDTASPLDETRAVCQEMSTRYIARSPGNDFGDAVRTGIREAKGSWILCLDSDGSHPPEFAPQLLAQRQKADIVIASRYVAGGYTENSLPLVMMSRILNWTYGLVLNLKCKDVSNSFKLYRASLLKELTLICANFDIIEEILFKILRYHPETRIVEVPFTFKKRMFGETKRNLVLFIATYLFTMIKLRLSAVREDRSRKHLN
jgi:dolichol-phosphate mannosyltransferase